MTTRSEHDRNRAVKMDQAYLQAEVERVAEETLGDLAVDLIDELDIEDEELAGRLLGHAFLVVMAKGLRVGINHVLAGIELGDAELMLDGKPFRIDHHLHVTDGDGGEV